jgi:hypothetical protein
MVVQDQVHGDIVGRLGQAAGHGTHSRQDRIQLRLTGTVPRHCDDSTILWRGSYFTRTPPSPTPSATAR